MSLFVNKVAGNVNPFLIFILASKILLFLGVLFHGLLLHGQALAQTKSCEKTLTVSANKNWPPYSYHENGTEVGLEIEILSNLLEAQNLCAKYVNYPSSSRAFAEFKKGEVDLIFAASMSKSRQSFAQYSAPYRREIMALFVSHKNLAELPVDISGIPASFGFLKNKVVALNRGSIYGELFEAYRNTAKHSIIETNHALERLNLVKHGRVDAAIEDSLSGLYLLQSHDLHGFVMLSDIVVNDDNVYYMIAPGVFSESELAQFNQAIHNHTKQNEQLIQRYFLKYKAL